VSDFNNADSEMERQLARALAPVSAPASLWFHIQEPRPKPRFALGRPSVWIVSPALAAVLITIVAGAIHRPNPSAPTAASVETRLIATTVRSPANRTSQNSCPLCHWGVTVIQANSR
jgi:hypothetical protein